MTKQEKLRILVIDDEVTQRMLVKEYLEEAGHVVRQSDDGMHGLKMAIATKPDVILLDLLLPSMDGYSLCKSLKDRPETAAIPIILITASRGSDVIEKGLAAGADDFLTKPVDWAYLADRVMNVVRKSRERADMERLIHQTRHNERQAPPAQVNEFAKADLARIETEQLEALTRTTEQVRAECASELAALQHHHAEELRSLRERNALDIESIRVSGQHSLMVAEHRHAGEIQSLRSAYEELSAEFEYRATGDAEAVASENAARVQAAWAIAHRWANTQSGLASAIASKVRSAIQSNPDLKALQDIEPAAKALSNSFGKFKLAAQSLSSPDELEEAQVDVASIVRDIAGQIDAVARERRLNFIAPDSDASLLLMTDENRLRYGLLALLTNAIRFTPAGGTVEFRYGCDDTGDVRIEIYDSGVGIAPARLQQLRQCLDSPARNNAADPADGAGLGIPVAMALSRQLGGTVELESQLGVGTCASMVFPASKRDQTDRWMKTAG